MKKLDEKLIEDGTAFLGRLVEATFESLRFLVNTETIEGIEEIPLDACGDSKTILAFLEHLRVGDDYLILERFNEDGYVYILEVYGLDKEFITSVHANKE